MVWVDVCHLLYVAVKWLQSHASNDVKLNHMLNVYRMEFCAWLQLSKSEFVC